MLFRLLLSNTNYLIILIVIIINNVKLFLPLIVRKIMEMEYKDNKMEDFVIWT